MTDDLVTAVWQGPFDGELPNMGTLHRGERIEIPRHQAEGSDHWKIVKDPQAKRGANAKKVEPVESDDTGETEGGEAQEPAAPEGDS